jgi:hypothetical protein
MFYAFFLKEVGPSVRKALVIFSLFSLVVVGCKDDPDPKPVDPGVNPFDTITNFTGLIVPSTGSITFSMDYQFNGSPITYSSKNYSSLGGDTFTINNLKHYLSNITLTKMGGGKVNLGNYHLLDGQHAPSTVFTIANVPAGHYTAVEFALGVDSARNYAGVQEGALDPAWGMFWTWNTGYIFFRINGNTSKGKSYAYDLGGSEHLVRIGMDLSSYKVKSVQPKMGFLMDVNELFQNPDTINFEKDGPFVHSNTDEPITKLKANMKDMVTVKSLTQ